MIAQTFWIHRSSFDIYVFNSELVVFFFDGGLVGFLPMIILNLKNLNKRLIFLIFNILTIN